MNLEQNNITSELVTNQNNNCNTPEKKSRATSRIITLDEDPVEFEYIEEDIKNPVDIRTDTQEVKNELPTEQSGNITF